MESDIASRSRIQGIIAKIEQYRTELNNMDMDVRLYLEDRTRYSHPQHEKLIDDIYRFEREIFNFNNSEVQFRLDGLLDSLMIHKRIWERRFDEDEQQRKGEVEEQYSLVNKVYKASTDIWTKQGADPAESKEDLARRILPEYISAKKSLKDGQKIVFTFDKEAKKVNLRVKDLEKPES